MIRLAILLALFAVLSVACSDPVADATSSTADGPPTNSTTTPDSTTTTTEPDPCPDVFCLIYHIHPDATWSDGVPVTVEDFVYTYETVLDPLHGRQDTAGYDAISSIAGVDSKTVLVSFGTVYGPWQTLFDVVLPAHVMAGGFDPRLAYTTTADHFVLDDWSAGNGAVLHRNGAYWSEADPVSGTSAGEVQLVEFLFSQNVRESLSMLEDGEVHYLTLRPLDWMIAETAAMEDVTYQVGPGHFWEHIDFNHDDPLLSQQWVRDVFDLAIDRRAILDATVRTVDPEAPALDNTVWMTGSVHYERHYRDRFDPESAKRILTERFCEMGDSGVFSCQGREMVFRWTTTVGDEWRETTFEIARQYLADVGIALVPEFVTASQLFSAPVLFGGPEVWQLINFSWKASADPHLGNSTYHCQGEAPSGFGGLNVNRYCSAEVDALIRATESAADPNERASLYNQADEAYLSDLALIPLYQKPDFAAWRSGIEGPQLNSTESTNLWNLGAWTGSNEVVIPLQSEPALPNPLLPADDDVALVLAPLLAGAFETSPDQNFVPVLVESVEVIVSEP